VRDSGLPKGWELATIGNVAETIRGVTYKKENSRQQPEAGLVPILRATNINGKLDFDDLVYVPEKCVADLQILKLGDIIIAASSGSKSVVGKAARLTDDWKGSFGAFCMAVRPSAEIRSSFLAYFMETPSYRHRVSELSAGVNINNLKREHIEETPFPVPSLFEQDRIVAEIETLLTDLDAAVAALKRVQANLKRYRASVLKAACEGRLVPTEAVLACKQRRTYETGEQLLARIANRPAEAQVEGLQPTPEGWTYVKLSSITQAVGGYAFKSKDFGPRGYQVVKMANVRMGRLLLDQRPSFIQDAEPAVLDRYLLRKSDLVVTLTGTRKKRDYGYVAVVDREVELLLNQRIARLRPFSDVSTDFLQIVMQDEGYRNRFFAHETGNVGQGNVGMAAVTDEVVLFAPLSEQHRIVAEVDRQFSVIDHLEVTITEKLVVASRLRQSILKRAFEGKLVPQDPNDEPASVLLDRIRAERAVKPNGNGKRLSRRATAGLDS
jgi:type I restriction enzyme S subunit